jgi:hypothetical protein
MEENFLKGVVIVKVFSTPFRPEVIKNEATKDVEGLLGVGEAVNVVREKSGGVVFEFYGGFTEEHKRPKGREVAVDIPFVPNALIGFLGALSHGTIKETVLRGFLGTRAAYLALGGDSHELELGAN